MKRLRIIGVIPARLESERLPRKVLLPLHGRAMLHHVYQNARYSPHLDELWVATDSEEVRQYCEKHSIPVMMTSASHRSGTERIHEVTRRVHGDVFVNLQADEPLLTLDHIRLLVAPFENDESVGVSTLKTKIAPEAAQNPNVVKVVTDRENFALYFSRLPLPFRRGAGVPVATYKHIGIYAYRCDALEQYVSLPPSPLEEAERLEQLRFLENRIPIYVAETAEDTIGVDTAADWEAAVKHLAAPKRAM